MMNFQKKLLTCVSLVFTYLLYVSAEGIWCYKCSVFPSYTHEENRLCSQFDLSGRYQVFCPKSTMCMKKTIHFTLPNGTSIITSQQRGCARQQHFYRDYDFEIKDWVDKEEVVETAYEVGCFIDEDKGTPNGPSEYCFCGFNFCNSAIFNYPNTSVLLGLIFLLRCFFS